jgi:hypothetical protein
MPQKKSNLAIMVFAGIILVVVAAGAIVYGLQNLKISGLQSDLETQKEALASQSATDQKQIQDLQNQLATAQQAQQPVVAATTTTPVAPTTSGSFTIKGLTFTLLKPDWQVVKNDGTSVSIQTATSPYQVDLVLLTGPAMSTMNGIPDVTAGIASAQMDACGGPMSCWIVNNGALNYEFSWDVQGNEPPPANLDGIWHPTANFTADDITAIMKTMTMAK